MSTGLRRCASTVGLLMFAVTTATAQPVINNTGVPANINGSFQDAFWQVSTDNGTSWRQALKVLNPPGVWQAATPQYSWISATTSGSNGGGNYLFRTFFDLTGYVPSTATLSFNCATDNVRTNTAGFFSLNGASFGGLCGSQSNTYKLAALQTLVSGFTGGINELRFAVTGDSRTDGLLVANTSLTANVNVVPEPASVALFGMGVISLAAVARRRNRTN